VHAFGKASAASAVHVLGADNVQGGHSAAQVLLGYGYSRMAFLGGPQSASSTLDRLKGFRAELHAKGFEPAATVFAGSYAHDEGRKMMRSLLASHQLDAVFCGDDILAIGALDACKEAGLSVPRDMGILGFNDIAMASWAAYDLSTIRQPIADIIVAAVDRAIELVENPALKPARQRFSCEAVLRGTLRKR
jgi:DNA-binding LacI/PurR family transcriptional regulator